jgi:hypothetical protein
MLTERIPVNPELARILEGAKANLPVPDIVRARVMARARAATSKPAQREAARGQRRRTALIALAASVSLIFGATGVALALFVRHGRPLDQVAKPMVAPAFEPSTQTAAPPVASPALAPVALSPKPTGRPRTPQESYAAELDLLYRSHAAYASGSFTRSLALLSEHARRFPKGQLTEEREALRVRALAGAGRTEEAKRASEAFAQRFPHSLLLPR